MYLITQRRTYGYGRPKIRYQREAWMLVKDPAAIRRARKARGFSQRDLAALCKCTQAAISALETGTMKSCSADLAKILCRRVERDLEDLFIDPKVEAVPMMTSGTRTVSPAKAVA
ncbi:helix-turn-helix transcriptional regulator [Brachybacterium paraconglomeratum]